MTERGSTVSSPQRNKAAVETLPLQIAMGRQGNLYGPGVVFVRETAPGFWCSGSGRRAENMTIMKRSKIQGLFTTL